MMSRGAAVDIVVSEEKKLEGLAVIESDGGVATLGSGRGTRHSIHTHVRDDARRTPTLKHGCNEHFADCGVTGMAGHDGRLIMAAEAKQHS